MKKNGMCPHSVPCTGELKSAAREKGILRQTKDRGTLAHAKAKEER